jgi:hypothetical protein
MKLIDVVPNDVDFDRDYINTYQEINIRSTEFGQDSSWKRNNNNKTASRITFTYSCDTRNEKKETKNITKALEFFTNTVKTRDMNPIGPLVLDNLKANASGLYNYLKQKNNTTDESLGEMLTDDIDSHFRNGFNLIWADNLNRFLVDYNIIQFLIHTVGYKNWSEVPEKQKRMCYRNYNSEFTLPDWNTKQERFER